MLRKSKSQLQAQCAKWNAAHPVGADVIQTDDMGADHPRKTTSAAMLLGDHSAVIWLTGISGCYALDRVRPS